MGTSKGLRLAQIPIYVCGASGNDLAELFHCIEINNPGWIPLMPEWLLPSIQLGIHCPT